MNVKCDECKGRGVINRDGKMTKTGKPYDVTCPGCNGIGHYRITTPKRGPEVSA